MSLFGININNVQSIQNNIIHETRFDAESWLKVPLKNNKL